MHARSARLPPAEDLRNAAAVLNAGKGQPIDFAAFARACGGQGFTIVDARTCGAILDEALAVRGPVLIEAAVDPHEPPMPPNIMVERATHFAEAHIKGQPNTKKIALTAMAEKVSEII